MKVRSPAESTCLGEAVQRRKPSEDWRMAAFLSASNGERTKGEVSNARPVIMLTIPYEDFDQNQGK
jgi:hypothetical protein